MARTCSRLMLASAVALAFVAPAHAGKFLTETNGRVTHPFGYTGTGGDRIIDVCLDPTAMPIAGDPTQATENVLAEFNRLQGSIGNVVNAAGAGVPGGSLDYESFLMHELGHCMGLDHHVMGPSEVSCTVGSTCVNNPHLFFSNTDRGGNNVYDADDGADNARGTSDDARGDDTNMVYFRIGSNNPFVDAPIADRTTYTQSPTYPGADTAPEMVSNFSPCVQGTATSNTGLANGQPATTDIMVPILCTANVVRDLSPNDRTMFRIARAGRDGTVGTSDDYTTTLNFLGTDQTGCDIQVRFVAGSGFFCSVGLTTLSGGDTSIVDHNDPDPFPGVVTLDRSVTWFFNQNDTTGAAGMMDGVFCNAFENNSPAC